jgi:hypothetical protein
VNGVVLDINKLFYVCLSIDYYDCMATAIDNMIIFIVFKVVSNLLCPSSEDISDLKPLNKVLVSHYDSFDLRFLLIVLNPTLHFNSIRYFTK